MSVGLVMWKRIVVAGLALLFFVAACVIQQVAGQARQGNMLYFTPTAFAGFYGEEFSATLPGAGGPVSRSYRWSRAESQVMLWPATAASKLVAIEYLNSPGPAEIQLTTGPPITLLPSERLRMLRLLLAPANETRITLAQTTPQIAAGRQIGLLVSNVEWSALPLASNGWDAGAALRLLAGLPLTLALLYGLALLARFAAPLTLALALVLLVGTALVAANTPWYGLAMQPALQCLLGAAIIGVGLWRLWRWWPSRNWMAYILAAWGVSLALFFSPDISSDGVGYYAYVRSLFVDGDLRFANEFSRQESPLRHLPNPDHLTATGYVANPWSVGPAIFWSPFWLAAHGLTLLGRQLGLGWQTDGYAPPYLVLTTLATALAGLATMIGCFRLTRRWFAPEIALLTAVTIYAGSNLLFYAQLAGGFAHSLSAATATWFLLAVLNLDDDPTLRRWLGLGLATGALLLTYWVAALLLIVPLGVAVRHGLRRGDGRALARLAAGGLVAAGVAALVFSPQMLAWKIIFGDWLTIPQGAGFARPQEIRLFTFLFGPIFGLPWWTPAYFALLLGCGWFALRRPWPGALLFAMVGVYIVYNTTLLDWHGSGAFGMRRLTTIAPLLAIGLALLFDQARRFPPLPAILAGALIVWGVRIMLRFTVYELPRDVFAIGDVGLRTVLLSHEPFPWGALSFVAAHSWAGTLLTTPDPGGWLILGACLAALLAGSVGIALWRRRAPGGDPLMPAPLRK